MKTLRLSVDASDLLSTSSQAVIEQAASILRDGGLVAFPTETVYGLGANALDAHAVEKIFLAKQRPTWDPLIVHISDPKMLSSVLSDTYLNAASNVLSRTFWPGPLTLLLPKAETIPAIVTAGRPLVGVRLPAHPVARALITAAGIPIAAPSANSFGRISPTQAAHVLEDLDGRIDAVLDAGETTHGLESTVVDASVEPVIVYRPGMITLRQIQEVCAAAAWDASRLENTEVEAEPASMPSPGISIRHYAPRAKLILIDGQGKSQTEAFVRALNEAVQQQANQAGPIGVMLPRNFGVPTMADNTVIFDWGKWNEPAELAHRLFAGLRTLDAAGVCLILCPLPPDEGIGAALRDRLFKASRS
jgi:L-threonylcarbamoyladenylate synthase